MSNDRPIWLCSCLLLASTLVASGPVAGTPGPVLAPRAEEMQLPIEEVTLDPDSLDVPGEDWDPFEEDSAGSPDGRSLPAHDSGQATTSVRLFDEVWRDFDETYSYFGHKEIDWEGVRRRHRSAFERELTAEEFAEQLASPLRELRDLHVSVYKPNGDPVPIYAREIERNYTSSPRNRYTLDGYRTLGEGVVWHAWLADRVAYLRIDTFSTDAFSSIRTQSIEDLFLRYRDAIGMIVDIRPNNGGNELVAVEFASRFVDETVVYGYTRTRNGPRHDDFDAAHEKRLEPNAGTRYPGPIVCLVGERCLSSAEWFTLMMKACPRATVIGTRTRGSSGNPREFELSSGVRYTIPTWMAFTPEMVVVEDRGIDPDVEIPAAKSFDSEHDYVVEQAIQMLMR